MCNKIVVIYVPRFPRELSTEAKAMDDTLSVYDDPFVTILLMLLLLLTATVILLSLLSKEEKVMMVLMMDYYTCHSFLLLLPLLSSFSSI